MSGMAAVRLQVVAAAASIVELQLCFGHSVIAEGEEEVVVVEGVVVVVVMVVVVVVVVEVVAHLKRA